MTTVRLSILLLALVLPMQAAQAAKKPAQVDGTVVDETGTPLKGVLVVATSPSDGNVRLQAVTNNKGTFTITVEKSKLDYLWNFSKEGHEPLITKIDITPGKVAKIDVTLPKDTGEVASRREATKIYNEGVAAYNDGDREGALALFKKVVETDPSMREGQLGLAETALALEDFAAAAQAAKALRDLEPENQDAPRLLLQAVFGLNDEVALAQTVEEVKGTPLAESAAVTLFNQGVGLLNDAGEPEKAAVRFRQAAELNPTLVQPHSALATLAFNAQNHEEVLTTTEALLALDPGNAEALRMRHQSAEILGKEEIAAEALVALQSAAPELASQQKSQQAEALFKANRLDDAKALLTEILAGDPDNLKANYIMGLCLLNQGDTAGARRHLNKTIELDPESQQGRDAKEMLQYVK